MHDKLELLKSEEIQMYTIIKSIIDRLLSLIGLIILSPVFLGTVVSVVKQDGVVEGGTGALDKEKK